MDEPYSDKRLPKITKAIRTTERTWQRLRILATSEDETMDTVLGMLVDYYEEFAMDGREPPEYIGETRVMQCRGRAQNGQQIR